MKKLKQKNKPDKLITDIKILVSEARDFIATNINIQLLYTYWKIGNLIVQKERSEKIDEIALSQFILKTSKHLTIELGKGFSRFNLFAMRKFYLQFKLNNKNFKAAQTL